MYCRCHRNPRHHYRRNSELTDEDSGPTTFCRFSTLYKDYKLGRSPYFTMPPGYNEEQFYQVLGRSLSEQLQQDPNHPVYNTLAHHWESEYPLSPEKEIYRIYPGIVPTLTETDINMPSEQLHLTKDIQYEFQMPYGAVIVQYDKESCFVCSIKLFKYMESPAVKEANTKELGPHEVVQVCTQIKSMADPKGLAHKSLTTRLRLRPGRSLEATVAAAIGAPAKTFGHKGPGWVSEKDAFKENLSTNTMTISRLAIGALFIALSKDSGLVQPLRNKKNLGATRYYTIGKEAIREMPTPPKQEDQSIQGIANLYKTSLYESEQLHWYGSCPTRIKQHRQDVASGVSPALPYPGPCICEDPKSTGCTRYGAKKKHQPTQAIIWTDSYVLSKVGQGSAERPRDRDTAMSKGMKILYDYTCQMCRRTLISYDGLPYAEGAHIIPFGSPYKGPDVPSNILVLCPEHHTELDLGLITVEPSQIHDQFQFMTADPADQVEFLIRHQDVNSPIHGRRLYVLPNHQIDPRFFEYHSHCVRSKKNFDLDRCQEFRRSKGLRRKI